MKDCNKQVIEIGKNKIRVYKEPEVYDVAQSNLSWNKFTYFLEDHNTVLNSSGQSDGFINHGHLIPEIAGRVCYMSFGEKQGRSGPDYLKHILEVGHGSVLEHFNMSFIICGISRSLSHELVRHRAGWAYSQLSQRYVGVEDGLAVVIPPEIMNLKNKEADLKIYIDDFSDRVHDYENLTSSLADEFTTPEKLFDFALLDGQLVLNEPVHNLYRLTLNGETSLKSEWIKNIEEKEEVFKLFTRITRTIRRKAARSTARSVLPNCTETKIFATVNARALRHFLELRGTAAAEIEIRRLAVELLGIVQPAYPWLFGDYSVIPTPDGIGRIETRYRKV